MQDADRACRPLGLGRSRVAHATLTALRVAALWRRHYMNRKSKRYPRANCNPCMNLTVIELF